MTNDTRFLRKQYGGDMSTARAGLQLRRGVRKMMEEMEMGRSCIVKSYDPVTQRADVVLKQVPTGMSPVYFDVEVMDTGGDVARVRSIVGLDDLVSDRSLKPTVGYLAFPSEDASNAWDTHFQGPAASDLRHSGAPVFFMGPLVKGDTLNLPADYEKGDDMLVDRRNGSHVIFKANGDIVIRAAGNVYIGGLADSLASMKKALRAGDTGDGGIGAGAIPTPSTRRVYIA